MCWNRRVSTRNCKNSIWMANSKRKCALKSCGTRFRPADGIVRGLQAWCGEDHQIEWAMAAGRKLRASKEREQAKIKMEVERGFKRRRQALSETDLKHQKRLTQKSFNALIRALDAGLPCGSCGELVCGHSIDCGHLRSVGSMPQLRYCPLNAASQGSACNRGQAKYRKNEATVSQRFEIRLRGRIGDDLMSWLMGPHAPKHYTCQQLIRMRAVIADEMKFIRENGRPSRNWRSKGDILEIAGVVE